MALPTVANVLEIAFHWTIDEDTKAITKLHWRQTAGTASESNLTALATAIVAGTTASLHSLVSAHVDNTLVSCTDLGTAGLVSGTVGGARAGSRTGGASYLPGQVCLVANYRIGRRYRGGKPRSYWPAGTMSDVADAQTWQTVQLAAGTHTLYTDLRATLDAVGAATGGGITLGAQCSISYFSGGHWIAGTSGKPKWIPTLRGTPVVDDILSMSLRRKLGTQKRRVR